MTLQNPDPDKLVEVFANTDTTLVIIARDALESVEIESFIFDEHASVGMVYGFRAPMRLHSTHAHGTSPRLEGERLSCTEAA